MTFLLHVSRLAQTMRRAAGRPRTPRCQRLPAADTGMWRCCGGAVDQEAGRERSGHTRLMAHEDDQFDRRPARGGQVKTRPRGRSRVVTVLLLLVVVPLALLTGMRVVGIDGPWY